jgi:hypothetical protein
VVCAMDEKVALASTLFSASFVVSDAASPLPPAGVSPWGVSVVLGFAYSPVDSFVLLAGLVSIVSSV